MSLSIAVTARGGSNLVKKSFTSGLDGLGPTHDGLLSGEPGTVPCQSGGLSSSVAYVPY
jgi:hypothetical protein